VPITSPSPGERVGVDEAGDAEVHHLDVAGGVQHHVLWLDVAVDDALAVGEREGVEQLDADRGDVPVAELAGQLVQRLAVHELPHQDAALAVAEPVVERHDVGVGESRGSLDLTDDAARHAAPLGDDLERDGLVEGDIERLVHVGEPAAADLADQLIAVAPVSVEGCGAVGRDGHSGSWDPSFGTVFGMVQSEPCKSCWASGGIGRRARFRV